MATETVLGVEHDDIERIRQLLRQNVTVFVNDFEPTVEHVQRIHDARLVIPGHGTLVRMWSDDSDILGRALVSGRDDVDQESLKTWREELLPVEERIRALSMPYRTIPNGMLFEFTVKHLAEIARITK